MKKLAILGVFALAGFWQVKANNNKSLNMTNVPVKQIQMHVAGSLDYDKTSCVSHVKVPLTESQLSSLGLSANDLDGDQLISIQLDSKLYCDERQKVAKIIKWMKRHKGLFSKKSKHDLNISGTVQPISSKEAVFMRDPSWLAKLKITEISFQSKRGSISTDGKTVYKSKFDLLYNN